MALDYLNKLYKNNEHFVLKDDEDGRFYTCDQEGCSDELMHVGDDYGTLEEAIVMVDFWASGGHWMDRPDMKG